MASERKPRLCVMAKAESGYGFHLHGEKGKSGQFIRKVEPGSPAEATGLRAGDRVVAVNGVNVEKETHHQASILDVHSYLWFYLICYRTSVIVACAVVYQQVTLAGACILTHQRGMGRFHQANNIPYLLLAWWETNCET